MASDKTILSYHLIVHGLLNWESVLADTRPLLPDRYEIDHVTLQPEWGEHQRGARHDNSV